MQLQELERFVDAIDDLLLEFGVTNYRDRQMFDLDELLEKAKEWGRTQYEEGSSDKEKEMQEEIGNLEAQIGELQDEIQDLKAELER